MSEYIERQKALDTVFRSHSVEGAHRFLAAVKPADVRPVVLCRDCKYWFNAPTADGFNSCERDALIRHENFFCAAGEKREGN